MGVVRGIANEFSGGRVLVGRNIFQGVAEISTILVAKCESVG
jgi:hypothetical protein